TEIRKSCFWELLPVYAQAWDTGAQACRAGLSSSWSRQGVGGYGPAWRV
ncbi:hypothetical protein A2U01_0080794, partial [Trifolium medium]|nr:hypothetical protein [Trifolium medium]